MEPRLAFIDRAIAPFVLVSLFVLANAIGNASPYLYLIALVLVWPFLLRTQNGRDALRHPVGLGYLVAFACLAIGFIGSAETWSDLSNLGNFLPLLLFFPAFALFDRSAGQNRTQIVAGFALAGAAVALASAVHDVWWLGLSRAEGFVNLTNPFAMASIMLGFLPLMGLLSGKGHWRFVFLLGPLMGTGAGVLAGTRSAPIVAVGLATIFAMFVAVRLPVKWRLIWGGIVALLALALVFAFIAFDDQMRALRGFNTIYAFLTEGTAPDNSTAIRIQLYIGGIHAFLDSPIFGFGWYDHVEAARQYMTPEIAEKVERWSHFHNDYLNFAALAGVFGIAFYALYLLLPVIGALKSVADSQYAARLYGALAITGSYALHGLFNTAFGAELLLCFSPVATAVLLGYCKDAPVRRQAL
ncbi:O-antigen ligase family protein [Pelagibacterium xiamenense]|uniref:O-antigen ligase family protein n=1 Tax=Pelagibacterium xiamenense TaxID=2901140 RepID=UPI001E3A9560|nr:O-antigen ligase family protein [Pelagibacterium xiamenense]MCD7058741.1 O-antigen ligase family protein [Pelagibacterium xiamenense]